MQHVLLDVIHSPFWGVIARKKTSVFILKLGQNFEESLQGGISMLRT